MISGQRLGQVGAFEQIAELAGKGEVFQIIGATMLQRDDMLDVKWPRGLVCLPQPTVFAAVSCARAQSGAVAHPSRRLDEAFQIQPGFGLQEEIIVPAQPQDSYSRRSSALSVLRSGLFSEDFHACLSIGVGLQVSERSRPLQSDKDAPGQRPVERR